jgi:hypothetical protein
MPFDSNARQRPGYRLGGIAQSVQRARDRTTVNRQWRRFLLTWSFLFAAPVILLGVNGLLSGEYDILRLPIFAVGALFYFLRAPESLVNTGGHIPRLTIPGIVILLVMPSLILSITALLMGRRVDTRQKTVGTVLAAAIIFLNLFALIPLYQARPSPKDPSEPVTPPGLDEHSYLNGYSQGHGSASIPLSQRHKMHERYDEIVSDMHLDKKSFDAGFAAGVEAANHGR